MSDDRTRVLIAFYSRDGSVEALANAMSEGAQAEGAEVRLRRARELVAPEVMQQAPGWTESAARMNALYEAPTTEDAIWAEAICLGSPSRFGSPASELRAWLETLGRAWFMKQLLDKVGSAFSSASSPHGGVETTVIALYPTMIHLGLIIVPQGYGHAHAMAAGSPYGVVSLSGGAKRLKPTDEEIELARYQGARVARFARATRSLRTPA